MNEEFRHIENLERYTKGEMVGDELEHFEIKLQEDASLLQELNDYQDMMLGIEKIGDDLLWNELTVVREKMKQERSQQELSATTSKSSARIIPLFRRLAIAASIILVSITSFYLLFPSTNDGDRIYANFYESDKISLPIILDDLEAYSMAEPESQQKKDLAASLKSYEDENYTASFQSLSNHLNKYPNDEVAQLYRGLTLMEQKNFDAAIENLEPLSSDANFEYQDLATWYLALCYIKGKETDQANKLVNKLATSANSNYKNLAKRLQEKLK